MSASVCSPTIFYGGGGGGGGHIASSLSVHMSCMKTFSLLQWPQAGAHVSH